MGKGFGCFCLGLGVGAALGMLLAPEAGDATRDRLMSKADEGREYLKKQTSGLRDSAADILDKGRSAVSRQRDTINDAIDAGKQAYREKVEQVSTQPV